MTSILQARAPLRLCVPRSRRLVFALSLLTCPIVVSARPSAAALSKSPFHADVKAAIALEKQKLDVARKAYLLQLAVYENAVKGNLPFPAATDDFFDACIDF